MYSISVINSLCPTIPWDFQSHSLLQGENISQNLKYAPLSNERASSNFSHGQVIAPFAPLYVSAYLCVCVYVYACICVCVCARTCMFMFRVCVCLWCYSFSHGHVTPRLAHLCVSAYLCMFVFFCACVCVYMSVNVCLCFVYVCVGGASAFRSCARSG
jgi:hypothetical protein